MELTFEFEFEFRNSEFGIWKPGCICRGACGPVALPLMVHCDVVTKRLMQSGDKHPLTCPKTATSTPGGSPKLPRAGGTITENEGPRFALPVGGCSHS